MRKALVAPSIGSMPGQVRNRQMRYRPEIDGLRAIAVLPVIFFHAGIAGFSGGFVGVDVFFVISGFLITSIIVADLERGKFSLVEFYERRARRILPALFFVISASIPFALLWMSPRDFKDFAESLMATATFSSNFLFWLESGYFSTDAEYKPLLHTWSLAIEEQFYILFPLAMILMFYIKKWIIWLVIIGIFISLGLSVWATPSMPSASFYLLPTRAWELLMGAWIALATRHRELPWASVSQSNLFGLVGLLLIAGAVFLYDRDTLYPGYQALLPTLGTALIIVSANDQSHVTRLLQRPTLVFIGLISYSAYLWHHIFTSFGHHLNIIDAYSVKLAILAATFGLSYLTWRYIEIPFRNRKGIFNRQKIFASSSLGAVALLLFGFWGYEEEGLPHRYSGNQLEAALTATPSPLRQECHASRKHNLSPEEACSYFVSDPTWAVLGDSHAVEVAYALAKRLEAEDDGVKHLSFSSCSPSFSPDPSHPCEKWLQASMDLLLNSDALQNIVVTFRTAHYLHGDHDGLYPQLPDKRAPDRQARIWRGYLAIVERLVDAGKTVYLVLQAPEVRVNINHLLRSVSNDINSNSIEGVSREWWSQRMVYVENNLADLPEGLVLIDPSDEFCDAKSCYAIKNNKSLYFDNHHVSSVGAAVIVEQILEARSPAPSN